jgi:hypothetical protein
MKWIGKSFHPFWGALRLLKADQSVSKVRDLQHLRPLWLPVWTLVSWAACSFCWSIGALRARRVWLFLYLSVLVASRGISGGVLCKRRAVIPMSLAPSYSHLMPLLLFRSWSLPFQILQVCFGGKIRIVPVWLDSKGIDAAKALAAHRLTSYFPLMVSVAFLSYSISITLSQIRAMSKSRKIPSAFLAMVLGPDPKLRHKVASSGKPVPHVLPRSQF